MLNFFDLNARMKGFTYLLVEKPMYKTYKVHEKIKEDKPNAKANW